jgi:hypothetical protein
MATFAPSAANFSVTRAPRPLSEVTDQQQSSDRRQLIVTASLPSRGHSGLSESIPSRYTEEMMPMSVRWE